MILADNPPIVCCPACGGIMNRGHIAPRVGLPDLHVVVCPYCNEVELMEEKRVVASVDDPVHATPVSGRSRVKHPK
jgi:hypothetical protein